MSNPSEHFRLAMAAAGLEPPDTIHGDGVIHRFNPTGAGHSKNGWYVLHEDGVAAGSFGCWRQGLQSTWCAKSDNAMTDAERDAHRQRIKAMKAQRDEAEAARHKDEANKAAVRWQAASTICAHPYLSSKGIEAYGIRQDGETLLVPLRDTAGKLHSLQTITPDGEKRFKGRMRGCYHAIGCKPGGLLVIAEGYATGASIHGATGWPVAVAFNAGNVGPVALALHKAYPALALVIAADDDWRTDGNPGMTAAKQAALAVGGFVVAPQFPADRPDKATDFNDLAALAGLDAVRACFSEIEVLTC
ncbi:MAG: toprim domain-containing protein [Candidatus Saccharibacteria bacterium]|nr:toprim domain-containing protein [Rhodoferax sp.]